MMYAVSILRRAQKALGKISGNGYEKIAAAIFELGNNPRPAGNLPITKNIPRAGAPII